jgi:hypothetical protein
MRFMILVKGDASTEAGVMPGEEMFDAMVEYHEKLAKAGVLLDAAGLQPTAKGWRIRHDGARQTVVDGPFAETKEIIAGYTIINVKSREEAREWTRRFPNPGLGQRGEIEVRQLFDLDDFEKMPAIERFRSMGLPSQQ